MKTLISAALLATLLCASQARAAQECEGTPKVTVYWERSQIEVGGQVFDMKFQSLGRKSARLVGNDMIFVHDHKSDVLIRHGHSWHLTCSSMSGG